MPIDWIFGLIGGLMIGLAGAVFLLANGKVMGASGIIGGLIDGSGSSNRTERIAFLAGLIGVPTVIALVFGFTPESDVTTNPLLLVIAGLLVGVGTRIANGCTSGHGVCGISRLSLRGIVATCFYIGAGGLTVVLFRHVLGVI
ncbi:YeeE/YedE family protein [Meridianimarinicoccus aquatilis]|uniref:YeeE/YedE family protein n=1 Tax=Meridianimarinicoccus aquatilis TaxID=2552766 RepID=A0A4R6B3D3_9RHOB|nr:YeeE/YedE thiosulfate transporter family protein [Fluviibacterium aquatile]QIE41852.1 YeeE/YedE family protein [Rhodobacteraceae bacterium SC52]TDL89436.1 YeeE/YedE family protein [Fluviibacterium aquatile]